MPVSETKRNANRRNSKKSTGPKSPEGKARVSQNAVTHGLFAKDIVINSPYLKENPDDYSGLLESLTAELHPSTVLQQFLVRKIANCMWRYQRAIKAETAHANNALDLVGARVRSLSTLRSQFPEDFEDIPDTPEQEALDRANMIGVRLIPDHDFGLCLLRYQLRLDREMTRAYAMLQRLQATDHNTTPQTIPPTPDPDTMEPQKITKQSHGPLSHNDHDSPDTPNPGLQTPSDLTDSIPPGSEIHMPPAPGGFGLAKKPEFPKSDSEERSNGSS